MSNEIGFSIGFKEKIRATIIEATMNLFTKEQMDELVNKEIQAFFQSGDSDKTTTSPWRKLVWNTVFEYMKPKFEAVFNEEESQIKKDLDEWFISQLTPNLKEGNKALFSNIAMVSSSTLQQQLMKLSATAAHTSLTIALQRAGLDYSLIRDIPIMDFSPNPPVVEQPNFK